MDLTLLGFASGIAANDTGCGDGPDILSKNLVPHLATAGINAHWQSIFYPEQIPDVLSATTKICSRLAHEVSQAVSAQQKFLVIGGDHSCAIGTWSGVKYALGEDNFGLIWIDAHFDAHTHCTSESGNIHGMPLACLLGHGKTELTTILSNAPKLLPENICIIGVRSYESGEAELIQNLGIRVYNMPEIKTRGMTEILTEAIAHVSRHTTQFGITLDLDAIDPKDAPGVGTSEPGGIQADDLCQALNMLKKQNNLIGLEIAEFNPHHDQHEKTERLIEKIIITICKS